MPDNSLSHQPAEAVPPLPADPGLRLAEIERLVRDPGTTVETRLTLCRQGHTLATGMENHEAAARCLYMQIEPLMAQAEYGMARDIADAAHAAFEALGNDLAVVRVRQKYAAIAYMSGEISEACTLATEVLESARTLGNRELELQTLVILNGVERALGNYNEAIAHNLAALAIAEQLERRDAVAATLTNLGSLLIDIGESARALDYYRRALQLHGELGNRHGEGVCLTGIGVIQLILEDRQAAFASLQQSLAIAVSTGSRFQQAEVLYHLGEACAQQKEYGTATSYLHRGLEIAESMGEQRLRVQILLAIGNILLAENQVEQARSRYQSGLEAARRSGSKLMCMHTLRGLSECCERQGMMVEALEHHREYHQLYAEIHEGEAGARLQRVQQQLEIERLQKAAAISRLKTERMEHELEVARAAQLSMLPSEPPSLDGTTIASLCLPALEVGGDYFDFIALDEGVLGLAIADVAGKGMPAAMHVALLKGVLRSFAVPGAAPRDVLLGVNRHLHDILRRGWFASMIYAVLDVDARTLCYACAGHNPLLVIHEGEQIAPVVSSGIALGLAPNELLVKSLHERAIPLLPGDTILLHTDGVTEAMNREREEYGDARLLDAALRAPVENAETMLQGVYADIATFTDGAQQHDDMTMVVVSLQSVMDA